MYQLTTFHFIGHIKLLSENCFLAGGNVNLSVVLRTGGGHTTVKLLGENLNEQIHFHNKHCSFQDTKITS